MSNVPDPSRHGGRRPSSSGIETRPVRSRQPSSSLRPPSPRFFCRYDSGTGSENGDNAEFRIFRERDFRLDELEEVDLGARDSPSVTIAPSANGAEETCDLLKTVSAQSFRPSRFRENLSMDDISLPSSLFSEDSAPGDMEKQDRKLPPGPPSKLYQLIFFHLPWALRFIYILLIACFFSLIPLMRLNTPNFHPENLPIIYSCTMLITIILATGLQLFHFRKYGVPWKRKAKLETLVFIIDLVLILLALGLIGGSGALADQGSQQHEKELASASRMLTSTSTASDSSAAPSTAMASPTVVAQDATTSSAGGNGVDGLPATYPDDKPPTEGFGYFGTAGGD